MTGHESLDGPEFVKPIMPPMKDHPGLKVLDLRNYFHFRPIFKKYIQISIVKYCASIFILGKKVLMNNFLCDLMKMVRK